MKKALLIAPYILLIGLIFFVYQRNQELSQLKMILGKIEASAERSSGTLQDFNRYFEQKRRTDYEIFGLEKHIPAHIKIITRLNKQADKIYGLGEILRAELKRKRRRNQFWIR